MYYVGAFLKLYYGKMCVCVYVGQVRRVHLLVSGCTASIPLNYSNNLRFWERESLISYSFPLLTSVGLALP